MIDQQIKEHNNLKQQKQQANKCPFSNQAPNSSEATLENPKDSAKINETDQVESQEVKASEPLKELNLNKKVVVSIQSNEEKQKENLLSKYQIKIIDKLANNCKHFFRKAPEQVHEYCKKLFEFDVVKVKKFK